MKTPRFRVEDIGKLFRRKRIVTMEELKEALGTRVRVTVFRKLRELCYHTSYSHCGRYYTLDEIAAFDHLGLWLVGQVGFSRHGTLLATIEALVRTSEAGYFADELEDILGVGVHGSVLKLVKQGRIARERISRRYLYCTEDTSTRRRQIRARGILESAEGVERGFVDIDVLPDEIKAAVVLFFSVLDEKQRRLYAGLEALKLGHGGDRTVADLLSLDVNTVARGRRELMRRDIEVERTRRAGAGRRRLEKKLQK